MAALLLAGLVEALGVCWSTMVDVDEERLKVLASGARCVSLSSAGCVRTRTHNRTGGRQGYTLLVSFQDMVAATQQS
jgi:hypothetical protein